MEQEAVQIIRDAVHLIDSRRELTQTELEEILSLEVVEQSASGIPIQKELMDAMASLQDQVVQLNLCGILFFKRNN